MKRKLLLLLALLALAAPQFISQSAQQVTPAAQGGGFGTIQGTIFLEGTTEPLADVQLALTGSSGMTVQEAQLLLNAVGRGATVPPEILQNAQDAVKDGASAATAVSDRTGQFTFRNVRAGMQTLRAQLEGYFGPLANGNYPPIVTLPVAVTANQTSTVRLSLIPGGTVSGRVIDPSGKPLSDGTVQLLRSAYQNGLPTFQVANIKSTDDRGVYRFYRMPPGEYYIAVSPRRLSLLGGALGNGGAGPRELPVPTFYPNAVDPTVAPSITVRPGDEVSGINIQMRNEIGVKVSGRVTSTLPPEPAIGRGGQVRSTAAVISLIPRDTRGLIDFNSIAGDVTANAEGAFEFHDVTPGVYDLLARLPTAVNTGWGSYYPPALATDPWAFGRTSVEVRSADVDNVSVVVRTGVDLKGRVILDGKPSAANVRISLQPDAITANINDGASSSTFNQIRQFQAPIAEDGSFTIPLLPEGRYRFQVAMGAAPAAPARGARRGQTTPAAATPPPLPSTAYLADIHQEGISVYDNGLLVGNKSLNPVDVLVNSAGGSLDGTVTSSDQKPATGATLILIPPENRRQNPALYKTARTDAQGRFNLTSLPPGRYTLFCWESIPPGAYQNAEFLSKYTERGVPVIIEAGIHATAAVNLIRDEKSRR